MTFFSSARLAASASVFRRTNAPATVRTGSRSRACASATCSSATAACSKAVTDSPRITRFLFNLGRAYHRRGIEPGLDPADKRRMLRSAFLTYEDAMRRGYVSALSNLAVLYEIGDGVEANPQMAVDL